MSGLGGLGSGEGASSLEPSAEPVSQHWGRRSPPRSAQGRGRLGLSRGPRGAGGGVGGCEMGREAVTAATPGPRCTQLWPEDGTGGPAGRCSRPPWEEPPAWGPPPPRPAGRLLSRRPGSGPPPGRTVLPGPRPAPLPPRVSGVQVRPPSLCPRASAPLTAGPGKEGPPLPRRHPLQAAPGRPGLLLPGPGGCRFSFPPAPIAVQPAAEGQPGAWAPGESGLTFLGQVEAAGFPVGLSSHRRGPCGETCKWGVDTAIRGLPLAGRRPSVQHLVPQWTFLHLGGGGGR